MEADLIAKDDLMMVPTSNGRLASLGRLRPEYMFGSEWLT